MAKYEDLVDQVAIHVSPCPEPAIIDALRRTVREFCEETRILVHDHEDVAVIANQSEIKLVLPEETTALYVWGMDGRTGTYNQSDDYYLTFDNRIVFNKQNGINKTLKPLLSLMPSVKSTIFSDMIMEYFQDTIIAGAVAYLQGQPHRAWSQPNAVGYHLEKYKEGIAKGIKKRDDGLNKSRSRHKVRPHYI